MSPTRLDEIEKRLETMLFPHGGYWLVSELINDIRHTRQGMETLAEILKPSYSNDMELIDELIIAAENSRK